MARVPCIYKYKDAEINTSTKFNWISEFKGEYYLESRDELKKEFESIFFGDSHMQPDEYQLVEITIIPWVYETDWLELEQGDGISAVPYQHKISFNKHTGINYNTIDLIFEEHERKLEERELTKKRYHEKVKLAEENAKKNKPEPNFSNYNSEPKPWLTEYEWYALLLLFMLALFIYVKTCGK